jgi:hypothetical protein
MNWIKEIAFIIAMGSALAVIAIKLWDFLAWYRGYYWSCHAEPDPYIRFFELMALVSVFIYLTRFSIKYEGEL